MLFMLAAVLFTGCSNDGDFDNKGFLSKEINKIQNLFIKPSAKNEEKELNVTIAKVENRDFNFTFFIDKNSVDTFNKNYKEEAILLPEANYEINNPVVKIIAGAIKSDDAILLIKDIKELDRDLVYVLPVRVSSNDIAMLESATITYYVFKGGALINVVGDIEKNYLSPEWSDESVLNNLSTLTMEALINARDFSNGEISSIMGIEGEFLIRLGDANFERNQIQVATSGGNFPGRDSSKGLPTNKWVHIAVTFDSGNVQIFVDGTLQSVGRINLSKVNLGVRGVDGFYVGRSYNDDRWLNGSISEARIWNKVRTQEEITEGIYAVDPESEGLVSYWKFDEGEGDNVADHTANKNHLKSSKTLKWNQVSLPSSNK